MFWEQSVGDYNFVRIIASLPEATMSIRDRGVASTDRMKHPEIVDKGGKAAHQKGTAQFSGRTQRRGAGRTTGSRASAQRARGERAEHH